MKICAATGNAGKLRELRRILEAQGHEVVSQKELGITIEPDETGTTFAENALIKAETICKASGLPTIADDSGLCVDALGGAPGVYSARYCGHHGDDEANNDKLLDAMKEVPEEKRGAKFVSAVCFILPDGRHLTCMGECPGSIAFERLNGDYGFGYDPLFIPADCGVGKRDKRPNTEHRSYAQLTPSATAATRWLCWKSSCRGFWQRRRFLGRCPRKWSFGKIHSFTGRVVTGKCRRNGSCIFR
jgi:XTP/dITP diphosphohydrolase